MKVFNSNPIAERSIASRRNFLGFTAAALALFPLTVIEKIHAEEVVDSVYDSLDETEGRKIATYTEMIHNINAIVRPRILDDPLRGTAIIASLHPEHAVDSSPEQEAIRREGKPCEFTKGYIYHSRANLGEILKKGYLPKNSFLTRVPQTWALQPFVDLENEPAIFVIDALEFNRWQKRGKAALRLKPSGEIYPSFTSEFPLTLVKQIITNKATFEKYKNLIDESKLKTFTDETHSEQIPERRFIRLRTKLYNYMRTFELDKLMPKFRLKTDSSTKDDEHSPKPLDSSEDLVRQLKDLLDDSEKQINNLREKEKLETADAAEEARLKKLEERKNIILAALGTLLASGGSYWLYQKFDEVRQIIKSEAVIKNKKKKKRP